MANAIADRRSEKRFQFKTKVRIRDLKDEFTTLKNSSSRDISSKGVFLELSGLENFEIGRILLLEIDLVRIKDERDPVKLRSKGRVVRRDTQGVGIKFIGKYKIFSR